MFSSIQGHQYVALRLPSDNIKIEQIIPNTQISLGKYGSFHTNNIIGRPYNLTFEILDKAARVEGRELRIIPASELHAEVLLEEAEPELLEDEAASTPSGAQFDEYGLLVNTEKSNVNITDDNMHQKLTFADIEALKSDQTSNSKELISKIMANHSQLDQKTAFSLAKYTLRKQKKYMKRFTVLPLDVALLADYMMIEKDFSKILEIRNEVLGLIGSWANVHASSPHTDDEGLRCRYLVVDDTGGLIVATLAERMGLLHHTSSQSDADSTPEEPTSTVTGSTATSTSNRLPRKHYDHSPADSDTITLVHANQQPNLALMRYFSFDPSQPPSSITAPSQIHPLHTHLSTLSWLQLLHPDQDTTYSIEPTLRSQEELSQMRPNHRSTYHRKRRRWIRTVQTVNTAREGQYDALVVATPTDPIGICRHLVPLLAGGAQIVVYSPYLEPLLTLVDVYSTPRRTAFLSLSREEQEEKLYGEDFPVDPTLTLGFSVQTIRARRWQVLPGRSHPVMTGKGGADGYIAVATRVIPIAGGVAARGRIRRGRKKGASGEVDRSQAGSSHDVEDTESVEEGGNMDVDIKTETAEQEVQVNGKEDHPEQASKRLKIE